MHPRVLGFKAEMHHDLLLGLGVDARERSTFTQD